VTAVGDIPSYLEDGKTAFMAAPGDADAFAGKLAEALEDLALSRRIGEAGREVAVAKFGHAVHAKRLHDFLAGLSTAGR